MELLTSSEPMRSRPITMLCTSPPMLLMPRMLRSERDEDERPEHAGQPAAAAPDAYAAEQHDGDDVELHAERVVRPGVGEPRGIDHAGDGADHPGDHEEDEPHAPRGDPGIERRRRIAADRIDPPAEGLELQEGREERDEQRGTATITQGTRVPGMSSMPKSGEAVGEHVDRSAAEQDVADPAEHRHRAERHHQRRQAEVGDETAVEGAEPRAGQQYEAARRRRAAPRPAAAGRRRRWSAPGSRRPRGRSRGR